MKLVSLDLSLTATGYATSTGNRGVLSPPKGFAGFQRLKWILDHVWNLTEGADMIAIEGYAFGRPNQAHQLGELGGVIRFTLWESERQFVDIPPSSLKLFATGKGNASKDEVLVEAVKKLRYDGASKDTADAMWALAMATAYYEKQKVPEYQQRAISKVHWTTLELKPKAVA